VRYFVNGFLRRVSRVLRHDQFSRELAEEVETHRVMKQAELERLGYSPRDAAAMSRRAMGNTTVARERARGVWFAPGLERVVQDLRFGARTLVKRPGMTTVAILVIALGIGANTALFSLVDASLFQSLRVDHPDQLVALSQIDSTGAELDFSLPNVERLQTANHSFVGMVAYDGTRVSVTVDGRPSMITGDFSSGNYFALLGVNAALGRTFTAADDQPGRPPVVVISDAYWTREFGRHPNVIGRAIAIGPDRFTVIGVMAADFRGRSVAGSAPDVEIPMIYHSRLALRDHVSFGILARLRPSVSPARAAADLSAIQQHYLNDSIGRSRSAGAVRTAAARRLVLRSAQHGVAGALGSDAAQQLLVVVAIMVLVLLIACVNVGTLQLAGAADRQKEMAVRVSLGAGRLRLVRQLLTESMLLSLVGAALGILWSELGARLLSASLPLGQLTFHPLQNPECLAFTAGLALATGVVFGLIPAITTTQVNVNPVLRGTDTDGPVGYLRQHVVGTLVVFQIALSVTLLLGAGLLVRSLQQLRRAEPGFAADSVLTMYAYPVLLGYTADRELWLYSTVVEKLALTPGVRSASVVRYWLGAEQNWIGPDYFRTMGIPIVRGREFSLSTDRRESPRVVIISEAVAHRLFGSLDPIGRLLPSGDLAGARVVGLVRNIKHTARQNTGDATIFAPYTQAPLNELGQIHFLVRTSGAPTALASTLRSAISTTEPALPVLSVHTVAEELGQSLSGERSIATLLSGFGALALVLAAIGLYGTMAQTVSRRTREMGIRMSLGASSGQMRWMILRETLALAGVGLLAGVPMALGATRLLSSMLFQIAPADPISLAGIVVLMVVVAAVAGLLPASRAARVDPMVALRNG
jgi:predicted permease